MNISAQGVSPLGHLKMYPQNQPHKCSRFIALVVFVRLAYITQSEKTESGAKVRKIILQNSHKFYTIQVIYLFLRLA